MARRECVRGVLKGAEDLTDAEIDSVIKELERKRRLRAKAGVVTDEARATAQDAERVAADLELAAKIERRNAKLIQLIHKQLTEDVARFDDPSAGIEAVLAGSNKRIKLSRFSVDALKRAYESKYLGGLIHDLRKANLLQYILPRFLGVGKGLLDDKIAKELWELRDGGKPGSTGSKEAQGIAQIVHKYQELARTDQNAHGAFIRKLDGYIVSQSHDMFRVGRAGRERWIADIKPLLDERTFDNIGLTGDEAADAKRIDDFLGFIWNELRTGQFMKAATDAPLIGFKGPANLAKKASQSRVLHFKDADSWVKYNDNYGASSLMEAVAGGLRHAAGTTALLERLGPNPKAMFTRVLSDLRAKSQDLPDRVRTRLQSSVPERLMDVVDGTVDIPSSITGQQIASGIRAVQTQASLGGAVLASLPDIATAASELNYQGRNFLGALGDQFTSMLAQITDGGQRREAAELVGVGADAIIRDIASRMTGADNAGRLLNKASTAFFKLNLLSQWTAAGERAVSSIMSRDLARQSGKSFDALPPRLKSVLSLYGIGAEDWDLIRAHSIEKLGDTEYITADGVRLAEGVDPRVARKVETKLRAYFADRSAVAVLEGGAREKLYTTQGTQAGTAYGEAVRFVMQFKQYGVSFVQKVLGRYSQEDRFMSIPGSLFRMPASEAAQLAQLVVTLTGLGYLAMAAKDIAKGREPRDPARVDTMTAAMMQGGGLGIYSDFLFAKVNRFGGGPLETAAGPTAGDLFDLVDLYQKSRDYATGVSEDAPDVEAWNFAKGNTPFLNLFYTRAALDYLILYNIQESLNPGSLRRMEQRLKREQGQEFILPPSEYAQ